VYRIEKTLSYTRMGGVITALSREKYKQKFQLISAMIFLAPPSALISDGGQTRIDCILGLLLIFICFPFALFTFLRPGNPTF
jgi:hypothetical protein